MLRRHDRFDKSFYICKYYNNTADDCLTASNSDPTQGCFRWECYHLTDLCLLTSQYNAKHEKMDLSTQHGGEAKEYMRGTLVCHFFFEYIKNTIARLQSCSVKALLTHVDDVLLY